jgi:glutamyl-tRNA synthetase
MTNNTNNIVVRIPPSPTGYFHVGRARTALFNYLFAKKHGGKIVFRIEDTDRERSKKEYEDDIVSSLEWLGITYDEGPFRQSERNALYRTYIEKMLEAGTAYISQETEGKNTEVIRLKNPNKVVSFTDLIRGEIKVDTTDLGDFVIARNIDDPLYHLTVVVDDHDMGITHVIRGDDGISNTPRQILIQEAIGATRPAYAHVPLILAPDKSKMSARHGATSLKDFRELGYLPEAMVNFLGLLGFNPGGEQEIYSLQELIDVFDLERVNKAGAVFNIEKLNWFNKEYIKHLPSEVIGKTISEKILRKYPGAVLKPEIIQLIAERIELWSDAEKLIEAGELDYFFNKPELDTSKIAWKTSNLEEARTHLEHVLTVLEDKDALMKYAEEKGKGNVLWPLRYVLSGKDKSPDPFTLLSILGKDESEGRVRAAIEILK